MGQYVMVRDGYDGLLLPNGKTYPAGATVLLSNAEYASLSPSLTRCLKVGATAPDPSPSGNQFDIALDADGTPYYLAED